MVRSKLGDMPPDVTAGEMMSPQHVAKEKGVAPKTVYTAIQRQALPAFQVDGRVYVRRSDALAWTPSASHADRAKRAAAARWHREKGNRMKSECLPCHYGSAQDIYKAFHGTLATDANLSPSVVIPAGTAVRLEYRFKSSLPNSPLVLVTEGEHKGRYFLASASEVSVGEEI